MFWLYEEELPPGVGVERFGAVHLIYIASFLSLALLCALFRRGMNARRRKSFDRILGSAVFFCGLCEYGVTALLGHMSLYALPLHVCALMYGFVFLHAWTGGAKPGSPAAKLHGFLGALIFHPGVLGALSALLFPDWLYYPYWHYLSLSSFFGHGLVLVYGASLLADLARAPEQKALLLHDLRASALFLALGALVMYVFDRASGTNYWFMAGPGNDSPFLGVYERGGPGGYYLAFALTAIAVTLIWYGLRYAVFVKRKR